MRVAMFMKEPPSSCMNGRITAHTRAPTITAIVTRRSFGKNSRAARKPPRISAIRMFIPSSPEAKITIAGTATAAMSSVRWSVVGVNPPPSSPHPEGPAGGTP
jgi:hypothetical protein